MVSIIQRFSLAWFLMAGAMLGMSRQAQAVDECGAAAAATADPYPEYNADSHASYGIGTRVREGTDVFEATGSITGAPDASAAQNGWTSMLALISMGVVCDSSDTTGYDATIVYDDDDLAIFYRRSDAQTITHEGGGNNAEIHILSGSVIKPNDGNNLPATGGAEGAAISALADPDTATETRGGPDNSIITGITRTASTDMASRRIFVGQGATVSNNDLTYLPINRVGCGAASCTVNDPLSATFSHAIEASAKLTGTVTAIIQGSVSAAAQNASGITLSSVNGDITMNISGSVQTRGAGGHAALAQMTGSGDADIDVSGTLTTSGRGAVALYAKAAPSNPINAPAPTGGVDIDLAGATITTTGEEAYGVRAQGGQDGVVTVDVAGNTRITTSGEEADGILAVGQPELAVSGHVPTRPAGSSVSGDVTVTIAGAAQVAVSGSEANAITARARGADTEVSITGAARVSSASGSGIYARDDTWEHDSTDMRSVTVSLADDAGARVSAGTPTTTPARRQSGHAAIIAHGETHLSQLSVTVGEGNFVCAGALSDANACATSSRTRAIRFWRADRVSPYAGAGTYAAVLTNAGTITGGVESLSPTTAEVTSERDTSGRFISRTIPVTGYRTDIANTGTITGDVILGAGDDRITNSGTLAGALTLGAGDDTVSNSGTLSLTGNADFGAGMDTLTSTGTGTLIINNAANGGRQISLMGLEMLEVMAPAAQTGLQGVISFVVDFSAGSPQTALLNLGDAAVNIASGVRVRVQGAGGILPITGGSVELFTGTNAAGIDLSSLMIEGRATLNPVTGALELPEQVTGEQLNLGLQTYDTLLQTAWLADRALARVMESAECEVEREGKRRRGRRAAQASQNDCGWMRVMSRFTRHDPSQNAGFNEDAYGIAAGYNMIRPQWRLRVGVAYDMGDVDQSGGEGQPGFKSESDRVVVGVTAGTGQKKMLPRGLDMDGTIRFTYATYEAARAIRLATGANVVTTGEPELLQVVALLGVESSGKVKARAAYGAWNVAARVEAGALYQNVESFTEEGQLSASFTTDDFQRVLGVGSASFRARGVHDSRWGKMTTWLNGGLSAFIGEVSSDLKASIPGSRVSASGTMEQIMFDVGAGFGYQPRKDMEVNLGYQGSVSAGNDTDIHHVNIRMNYLF